MTAAPISVPGGFSGAHLRSTTFGLTGPSGEAVVAKLMEAGQGRPIVFLHGLVGLNDHWEEVVSGVQRGYRCLMLELPLLGLRGLDCSVGGVVALTSQFLEERLGEPAILVGNSFGGHVALRIAMERPELVRGLVLAGSSGLIERTMVREITVRPSREWLARKIGELFYDPSRHMREADLDRAHRELSTREGARAMVKLSRSARSDHLGERIGGIAAPTLLVWGRNDVVTPPEAAAEFLCRLRDARIVWFDRCGHAPMMERPAAFAEAVLAFAGELDRRGGGR